MSRRSTKLVRAALSALHYSGAAKLLRPVMSGRGVIFMLHHVTPGPVRAFDPNGILKVTPEFLDEVIIQVKAAGFECIALDDVPVRLNGGDDAAPFVVFTLDDGYKDNRDYAYPVFKRHGVPFTIYVPSSYADGIGDLWWLNLEAAIRTAHSLTLDMDGVIRTFNVSDDTGKNAAFEEIYWWLRQMPEDRARAVVWRLAREAGADLSRICSDLVMNWDKLRELAADPLVTIGAHTTHHMALAKLSSEEALDEMEESVARIAHELGRPCRHFSYPYGCEYSAGAREFEMARKLGLATAVTTRKGLIQSHHAATATALPRLSLNGDFQKPRYVEVLLSGAPFALLEAAKRLASRRPAEAVL